MKEQKLKEEQQKIEFENQRKLALQLQAQEDAQFAAQVKIVLFFVFFF